MRTPRLLSALLALGLLCLLSGPAAAALPPVYHVYVIVLENQSSSTTFGAHSPAPYLSRTLRAHGAYLPNFYGIGHESNDNYIAMISGQAPNAATQSDCQLFSDFPAPVTGAYGQQVGAGCVYPQSVPTIASQFGAAGLTWRDYNQDMGATPAREASVCGHPAVNGRDGTQSATAADHYATRHNPFVYFHSVIDNTALCNTHVVALDALPQDLAGSDGPNLTFITPNLCNDGHDNPCVGKNVRGTTAGGLTAVDYWLQKYVPLIMNSPAFRQDGVLVIAADESENNDATACCNEQPGLNTPLPGITGPGGGRIGALVIGRCVQPGGTSDVPYNHYSLLRSLEDVYGISRGGSDGAGHLGYAGAAGLVPFGNDVFAGTCGAGSAVPTSTQPRPSTGIPATAGRGSSTSGALPSTGGLPYAMGAVVLTAAAVLTRRSLRKAS